MFLYTAPFFVALGSHQFLGERLSTVQWSGLALSFAGVALAIGVPQPNVDARCCSATSWWSAAARCGRRPRWSPRALSLRKAAPEKALGYQVAISIPILGLAAWIAGERIAHVPSALSISLLAYQAVWVVGCTFVIWFAMVKTYSASKLSAFTFITPLFGVVAAYFIMHDTLTPVFGVAALLVITRDHIFQFNKPNPGGTLDLGFAAWPPTSSGPEAGSTASAQLHLICLGWQIRSSSAWPRPFPGLACRSPQIHGCGGRAA